jgi:DNA-binding PadR family transcriptional regulator
MTPKDRKSINRMAANLKRARESMERWRARILQTLRDGPATRYELRAELAPTMQGDKIRRIETALKALMREGLVRERPELLPARRVKVEPVVVLEVCDGQ